MSELLDYVHISSDELMDEYRAKLAVSDLSDLEKQTYETELLAGLNSYTYLAK
ncbi:MAG: hypothetical protein QX193_02060 [Methylococcales bacterium]